MNFVYPLGLLGLIGIPILIIIYIIKNKYTEQTIASTYIWKLSERFLKKRKPISKLRGLISLILQCLIVLFVSFLIADPAIIIKGGANDYCFIVDGSASMNKTENGISRFDLAKDKVEQMINDAKNGSSYTIIFMGNDTQIVCEKLENKKRALDLVSNLSASSIASTTVDAISYAQAYFNENASIKTYLISDKAYDTKNVELINVASNDVNYAITNCNYRLQAATYNEDGSVQTPAQLIVSGEVISYNENANLSIELKVNDVVSGDLISVNALANQPSSFSFVSERDSFTSFEVSILNQDNLDLDNHYVSYDLIAEHNYSALIVSENPFYLAATLESYGKIETIDIMNFENYNLNMPTGYGLYIFDSQCTPDVLPSDGTVWMFNPTKSISGSGFAVLNADKDVSSAFLEKTNVYGDEKSLVDGYIDSETYKLVVKRYTEYSISRNFKTLFTCDGKPAIFTGTTSGKTKIREIVFSFDIHYSNLAMSVNALRLFNNMLDFSFPTVINSSNIECGQELSYNVLPQTKNMKLIAPSGTSVYLDCSGSTGSVKITEVGTYEVVVSLDSGLEKKFSIYSSYPLDENNSEVSVALIEGVQENNNRNGSFSLMIILYIGVALLFVADWAVYCYEQHQLY